MVLVVLLGVFYAGDSLFGTAFSPRVGLDDDLITLTLIVGFSFSPAGLAHPCRGFLSTWAGLAGEIHGSGGELWRQLSNGGMRCLLMKS